MPRANTPSIQVNLPPGVATTLVVTVVVFGMTVTAAVLGTALYGPEEKSDRAFRLIDRLKKAPDPEKPHPTPQARRRTGSTARGESARAATLRT